MCKCYFCQEAREDTHGPKQLPYKDIKTGDVFTDYRVLAVDPRTRQLRQPTQYRKLMVTSVQPFIAVPSPGYEIDC